MNPDAPLVPPPWRVAMQYNDAPEIPRPSHWSDDDDPIDYAKGPHNSKEVFGEDLDDDDPREDIDS